MAASTIPDAHETMRILLEEVRLYRDKIKVPVRISLLFGIHTRERNVGFFKNPKRKKITLRQDDQIIVTADRRVQFLGCRAAVYCNCLSTIPFITPNQTIKIGSTVILRALQVVRQSIVCTVEIGGEIWPQDPVNMPILSHDSEISGEGIEDIEVALKYGAHSIVVKTPRNRKYFNSIDEFIRSKVNESVHILTMCKTSDLRSHQQEHFINTTYDGVIYKLHTRFCADASNTEPIVPSIFERNLMKHLHESRKPFYLVAELNSDRDVVMPNVSPNFPDVLHYYTDGFLVPLSVEVEPNCLIKFTKRLVQINPMEKATSLRMLLKTELVDETAAGRLVLFRNAALASYTTQVRAIVMRSKTGRSALEMAQFRPACQILSITNNVHVAIKLVLNKAIKNTLRSGDRSLDPTSPDEWHIYQRALYLHAIYRNLRKRVLRLTDSIIILCVSCPTVRYLDTFHMCTVNEFLIQSERHFVPNNYNHYRCLE